MDVRGLTPILNVSDIDASFEWFEAIGWKRLWRYEGDGDGVWMTWWVPTHADVDEAHARAVELGLDVVWPPTDEPWGVREFHLRHPDGHTFRVSSGLPEA